jgi:hypothetical protein
MMSLRSLDRIVFLALRGADRWPRRVTTLRVEACGLWYTLVNSEGVTEREIPPTARERALYDAATKASPEEFVRLCWVIGREPREVLDAFDAAPWRWLIVSFAPSGYIADGARDLQFPSEIRAHLDATRQYVERPWWRRAGRH